MSDIEKATAPGALETAGPGSDVDGLDEVEARDLTMPILRIDHNEAKFIDNLTNESFSELTVICLGLTKQRILWPLDPGDPGEKPLCRSYEYTEGHPNPDKWDRVLLTASGFSRDQVESGDPLHCADCKLKEWNTNPKTGGTWCNEQYTIPLLILSPPGEDGETRAPSPAVISFVRTGIKPVKNYVSGFVQAGRPLYTAITKMTLTAQRKGTVDFAVPRFTKLSETDPSMWPKYSTAFHGIRDYLQTPRLRDATAVEPGAPAEAPPTGGSEVAPPKPPARAKPGAPPPDDDEEPF